MPLSVVSERLSGRALRRRVVSSRRLLPSEWIVGWVRKIDAEQILKPLILARVGPVSVHFGPAAVPVLERAFQVFSQLAAKLFVGVLVYHRVPPCGCPLEVRARPSGRPLLKIWFSLLEPPMEPHRQHKRAELGGRERQQPFEEVEPSTVIEGSLRQLSRPP